MQVAFCVFEWRRELLFVFNTNKKQLAFFEETVKERNERGCYSKIRMVV